MKLENIKIEQDRKNTNKSDLHVFIDYSVNLKSFDDYKGKNPLWAIFFIDKKSDKKPYKVRWHDYDGWREDNHCNFETFEAAAKYLYEQVQWEKNLVSRMGWVSILEDYDE